MRFYIEAPTLTRFLLGFAIWHFFWILIGIGGLLLAQQCSASEFHLMSTDELSIEYYKYRTGYRNPYLLEEGDDTPDGMRPMSLVDGAELKMDLSLLEWGYWRNRFHMANDPYKHVRYVGWEWEGGLDMSRFTGGRIPVELFEHHHSQHGLEYINPRGDKFPVEDTYGIRFKLIEGGK